MEENKNIEVAIVEDDDEIRLSLQKIIDGSQGFSCRSVFTDCESAVKFLESSPPDVILMDIELPGMNGIEGVRRLYRKEGTSDFIMLTIKDDDESIFQSLCSGAVGYLLKDTPPARILESIREVREGGSPVSPSVARKITRSFMPSDESPLSQRETEILEKLCDGHNYNVIADNLFISGHTVRAHIKNIYRKLQVNSRAAAVKKALQDKLV